MMQTFALIVDGAVWEVLKATKLPPFHKSMNWKQCPAKTTVGMLFDGEAYSPAPVIIEPRDRIRRRSYPPVGDQLDAILKWINVRRLAGENMPKDLDGILGAWLQVKADNP
jgi:hypothetical protein